MAVIRESAVQAPDQECLLIGWHPSDSRSRGPFLKEVSMVLEHRMIT
jgi:hypothetical protein